MRSAPAFADRSAKQPMKKRVTLARRERSVTRDVFRGDRASFAGDRRCAQLRGGVPVRRGAIVREHRDVLVLGNAVGKDRSRAVGAIENPPTAFVFPEEPGMADFGGAAAFADDVADVFVAELIAKPKRFGFAIAGFPRRGDVRQSGDVRVGERISEVVTFTHQLPDALHRDRFTGEGAEDLLHRMKVGIVRSESGARAKIDRGEGDAVEEKKEDESAGESLHVAMRR